MHIETFEQACERCGYDAATVLPDVSKVPAKHQEAITAHVKLAIITEAANEGHQPDWNDSDERKWIAWFDMEVDENNPTGFRFHDADCDCTFTYSGAGSRLCFKTANDAEYHGKQHVELYRQLMTFPK